MWEGDHVFVQYSYWVPWISNWQSLLWIKSKSMAMDWLISDNAKAQISDQVKEILHTFCIKDWQSEPYKGNQNFVERAWKDTKTHVNNLLNMSGAPPELWLQALYYICMIQIHTAFPSLNYRTPTEWLLGYTPDITVLLQFQFWEPVYYAKYNAKFPADTTEVLGWFIGIAENVGSAMTFKILSEEGKVIHRSVVCSAATEGVYRNKRADENVKGTSVSKDPDPYSTTQLEEVVLFEQDGMEGLDHSLPNIDVPVLLGRTFINDPDETGEQTRAWIEKVEPIGRTTPDGKQELFQFRGHNWTLEGKGGWKGTCCSCSLGRWYCNLEWPRNNIPRWLLDHVTLPVALSREIWLIVDCSVEPPCSFTSTKPCYGYLERYLLVWIFAPESWCNIAPRLNPIWCIFGSLFHITSWCIRPLLLSIIISTFV